MGTFAGHMQISVFKDESDSDNEAPHLLVCLCKCMIASRKFCMNEAAAAKIYSVIMQEQIRENHVFFLHFASSLKM